MGQLWPHLNERTRRMVAAVEARKFGFGGVSAVRRACGLSRVTIHKGIQELDREPLPVDRIRRPGAGRPNVVAVFPDLPTCSNRWSSR